MAIGSGDRHSSFPLYLSTPTPIHYAFHFSLCRVPRRREGQTKAAPAVRPQLTVLAVRRMPRQRFHVPRNVLGPGPHSPSRFHVPRTTFHVESPGLFFNVVRGTWNPTRGHAPSGTPPLAGPSAWNLDALGAHLRSSRVTRHDGLFIAVAVRRVLACFTFAFLLSPFALRAERAPRHASRWLVLCYCRPPYAVCRPPSFVLPCHSSLVTCH